MSVDVTGARTRGAPVARVARREALACAAGAFAAAFLGGAGSERIALARGRAVPGGKIALRVPWAISTIDPHRLDDVAAALFGDALFDGLYARDEAGNVVPVLAEADPVVAGGDVTIAIRSGITTAAGRPIDARDVVASISRARGAGASAWLADVPVPVRADTTTIRFPGAARDPAKIARALASPLTAVVPLAFAADRPDGTGPFRAERRGDALVLAKNPRAARGPALLEEITVRAAPDLAGSLRAFESGADDLGWLGSGLHEPRAGARTFDCGAVAWAVLRTGREAGSWDAPGVAQRVADGVPYARVAYLALGAPWPVEREEPWGGPPTDLLVRDDAPWLVELARAVAATLSRPSHELTVKPVSQGELASRLRGRSFALAIDVVRSAAPGSLAALVALATADGTAAADLVRHPPRMGEAPARTLTRLLRLGILGEIRVQGGRTVDVALPVPRGRVWRMGPRRCDACYEVTLRLAPRLVLAFGALAALSTAGLGAALREERVREETRRFDDEVRTACGHIVDDVKRQAESDCKLVTGACHTGELVDRTLLAMEAGDLDERRLALASLVPGEREAFDFDALVLATDTGEVLGADPRTLLGLSAADVSALVRGDPERYLDALPAMDGLVARCKRSDRAGRSVALIGVRRAPGLLARLGKTANVEVAPGRVVVPSASLASATCDVVAPGGAKLTLSVTKSKEPLYATLHAIDEASLYAALVAIGVALILAVLVARSLGRPISELAAEARKVARGEARPLRVRGSGEIAELTAAFDKMLEDLEGTRRRLAATSRVAAWREVARRVAHEVKNPLAPIRAAVETLRRLRARQDPAFDEYFDEATRTVLDEVHRISNIVTEFTRFARLSPPRPQAVDIGALVKDVLALQRASASGARIDVVVRGVVPSVQADRDQIVQVVTNLVANAVDAVGSLGTAGEVRVVVEPVPQGRVAVQVEDNGAGIAPEIAGRLFEPYATNKPHGTGLGLAIAQRIAIEHGGELAHMQSTRKGGKGAVFRLVLPIEGPPPVSEMPASS